jgi:hypothetical protein
VGAGAAWCFVRPVDLGHHACVVEGWEVSDNAMRARATEISIVADIDIAAREVSTKPAAKASANKRPAPPKSLD